MLHAGAVVYAPHDHTDVKFQFTTSAPVILNVPQLDHVNSFGSHVLPLK